MPRFRMSGAISPLLLYTFMAWRGTASYLDIFLIRTA
jgi:hypothetical protein